MMLTGESNESLKGGWEPNAELTPFLSNEKSADCSLTSRGHFFLPPRLSKGAS